MVSATTRLFTVGAFCLALLAGCATAPQSERLSSGPPQRLARAVELEQVPFFPQEQHQCGPAALATALGVVDASITPEALAPQVYLPEREGSLQMELIAATRRQGAIPYVLAPKLEAVLWEVQAGHPVVVLQNLALSWYPRWHYAVVVGYDLTMRRIVLRSGSERRHVIELDRFERTWERGGFWAMVALSPDRLPATAEELPYLKSAAAFETLGNPRAAHAAYAAALTRWPESATAWMGLGNTAHALGEPGRAEAAFRRLVELDPHYAPAFNNLAQVLAERGALNEAESFAQRAVHMDGGRSPLYAQTLAEIRALKAAPAR